MSGTCPNCQAAQDAGLLCSACCDRLEKDLAEVRALMTELDVTISKQARIGGGGKGGPARERTPVNWGAAAVADDLTNTLTTWARDVGKIDLLGHERGALFAAAFLLSSVDAIRRHPAVEELVDEISDAVTQARRAVDRPADRVFVGPCLMEYPDDEGRKVTCLEDLYARPGASEVRCRVCGSEHPVEERQAWLLEKARPRLFTVREASSFVAAHGNTEVNQKTIRTWIDRKQLIPRPGPTDERYIVLGELLDLITAKTTKANSKVVA